MRCSPTPRRATPTALAALDDVGRWLGIGLAGLVNTLNPARVVLGGQFARFHPFVAATVADELDRRALAAARRLVDIVPAQLGVDAPLLGAAELALEPVLADPATWSHDMVTDNKGGQLPCTTLSGSSGVRHVPGGGIPHAHTPDCGARHERGPRHRRLRRRR